MSHVQIFVSLVVLMLALEGYRHRKLSRMERHIKKLAKLGIEHEMLVDFYCEYYKKTRSDLPTRHNGLAE